MRNRHGLLYALIVAFLLWALLILAGAWVHGFTGQITQAHASTSERYADELDELSEPLDPGWPMLTRALRVADGYWCVRWMCPPTLTKLRVLNAQTGALAWGSMGEGHVWLDRSLITALSAPLAWDRVEARWTLCYVLTHERGHNAWLSHDAGWPVMHDNLWLWWPWPRRCSLWAERPWLPLSRLPR